MSDKTIYQLTELENVSQDDELIVYDVSDTTETPTKKVKVKNFLKKIFSTTEQFTGNYWIDGKPIYRKSFSASGISSEVIILSTELNKTTITPIKVYGFGENSANGDLLCIGYGNGANVLVNNSHLQFGGDYVFSAYNITIEYTKTTD